MSEGREGLRCTAIILADGKGKRMQADRPKQYLLLGGKPLFMHAVKTFAAHEAVTDLVVVVPGGDEARCEEYLRDVEKFRGFAAAGEERYHSVHAGLKAIDWPCDYVLVHDGARPFVTDQTISAVFADAVTYRAAVAAHQATDTIKMADKDGFAADTLDRRRLWDIQTPQGFAFPLLAEAYNELMTDPAPLSVTDDASVVELYTDTRVRLTASSAWNIKITTPEDMTYGEALWEAGEGLIYLPEEK